MKRFFPFVFLLYIFSNINAQTITRLKSTSYIGISEMAFDADNNRYLLGKYKGTPETFDLPRSEKTHAYIAKLNPSNEVIWAKPIDQKKLRFDMSLQNGKIYVLATTSKYNKETRLKSATANIEVFDITNGSKISDTQIAKMDGKDVNLQGDFDEGRVLLRAKWKTDQETTLNDKKLIKKKYSAILFQNFSLDGTKSWEHQIEGGFNNFTDIRIGDVDFDKSGNAYIVSYFSESLELGNASYTTPVHFEHPTLPLYFNSNFLMKIDKDGNPSTSIEIAKYAIDFEKIMIENEKIYLLAYYRGNKSYSDANEENNKPVEFMGETLPDCQSNPGTNQPGEDLLVACLDLNFNLVWKNTARGSSYVRAKSMCIIDNNLTVAATSSSKTNVDETTIDGFAGDGYGDALILNFDSSGKLKSSNAFHGPGSISASVYSDASGKLVTTIYFNKDHVMIDGEKVSSYSSSACEFIYDSSAKSSNNSSPNSNNNGTDEDAGLKIGDRVQGNWKGQGRYYPGKISKIDGDRYFIQYDDGDTEWTTSKYIKKQ